jgi:hypothetical protein
MPTKTGIPMSLSCWILAWFLWTGHFTHIEKYLSIWEFILLSTTCKELRDLIRRVYPWLLQPRDETSMIVQTLGFIGKVEAFQVPILFSMSFSREKSGGLKICREKYRGRRVYRFDASSGVTLPTYLLSNLELFAKKQEDFELLGLSKLSIDDESWNCLGKLGLEELFIRDCVFEPKDIFLSFKHLDSLKVLYYIPTPTKHHELCLPDTLKELYIDLSHLPEWASMTIKMDSCASLEKV